MADERILTAEIAREWVRYEPETGLFFWRRSSSRNVKVGDRIGATRKTTGYKTFGILYKRYYAHRVAWLWMTGDWPLYEIDHINGDPSDNRWSNLRSVTRQQNMWNRAKRRNNTSGFKGVSRSYKGKWQATIHLGNYATAEEAAEVYRRVNALLRGDFIRPD